MAYSKATFQIGAVEACHCVKLFSLRIYTQDRLRITEALSRNSFCYGKTISITYSESVFVALGIQHAMRMRCVKLSTVTCPVLSYFTALSQKGNDFRKNVIEYKMCVLVFSATLAEIFLIIRRTPRDIINLQRSSRR